MTFRSRSRCQAWLHPRALGLLVLFGGAARSADELAPSTGVIVLSREHSLRLITTTTGRTHESPSSWRNSVEQALNTVIDIPQGWKSPARQTFPTQDESLGLWFRDDPATQPGTKGVPMPVAPVFFATLGTLDHLAGRARSNPSAGPWSSLLLLELYPRRTPEFVVNLFYSAGIHRRTARLNVQNPSPRPDAGWRAESFPVRIADAGFPIQLHDLRVTGSARTGADGGRWIRLETQADWSFVGSNATRRLVAAQLRDPGGNRLDLDPLITTNPSSTNSLGAFGSLFFDEPVWQLDLTSTDPVANSPTAEIVAFGPVDILGLPSTNENPLRQANTSAEGRAIRAGGQVAVSVQVISAGDRKEHQLAFSLEGMNPGFWAELTAVSDDLGRTWAPAQPFGTVRSLPSTYFHRMLVPHGSSTPPPRRFTVTFTFRPARTHSVRVIPRFVPGNLDPKDLEWPLRPRD